MAIELVKWGKERVDAKKGALWYIGGGRLCVHLLTMSACQRTSVIVRFLLHSAVTMR
jgi:hypothetical protein